MISRDTIEEEIGEVVPDVCNSPDYDFAKLVRGEDEGPYAEIFQ
jgi:hypothetical protein